MFLVDKTLFNMLSMWQGGVFHYMRGNEMSDRQADKQVVTKDKGKGHTVRNMSLPKKHKNRKRPIRCKAA